MDEPEAALSPQRQMTLLCYIHDLVKNGSQFIIATHSPILLSYKYGKIIDMNNCMEEIKYEDTEVYRIYKDFLDNPYGMQDILFEEWFYINFNKNVTYNLLHLMFINDISKCRMIL